MIELLSRVDAARLLGVAPQTLAIWAIKGFGPSFIRVGRRPMYDMRDLERFIDARRARSTAERTDMPRFKTAS